MRCSLSSGRKKRAYILTQVERDTRCFVAHRVAWERTEEALHDMIWCEAPSAHRYFTDGFPLYGTVGYPGAWEAKPDKSETYSVEGDNAELRHYLARLVRKSRCFSRCLHALARAVDLFVYYWNRRQRWNRENPRYKRDIRDFIKTV